MIRDLGQSWSTVVYSDASATLGVIQRHGLVRLKHADCNFFICTEVQSLSAKGGTVCEGARERQSCGSLHQVSERRTRTKQVPAVDGRYSARRPTLCPAAEQCCKSNFTSSC